VQLPDGEPKLRAVFDKSTAKFGTVLVDFDQNLAAEAPTALPPVAGVARPQFSIAAGSSRQKYQVLDLRDL
jgi:hypothetical protein